MNTGAVVQPHPSAAKGLTMASLFYGPAWVVYFGGGLWGLILIVQYLESKIGIVFTLLSFILLPVVYYVAPLYAGVFEGYWTPLFVGYGSTLVATVLVMVAKWLDSRS